MSSTHEIIPENILTFPLEQKKSILLRGMRQLAHGYKTRLAKAMRVTTRMLDVYAKKRSWPDEDEERVLWNTLRRLLQDTEYIKQRHKRGARRYRPMSPLTRGEQKILLLMQEWVREKGGEIIFPTEEQERIFEEDPLLLTEEEMNKRQGI